MSNYKSTTFRQRQSYKRMLRNMGTAPGAYDYLVLDAYAKKKAATTARKVSKAMRWSTCENNPELLKRMAWRWHPYYCTTCRKIRTVTGELRCIVKKRGSIKRYINHLPLVGWTDWTREISSRYPKPMIQCRCDREP